eukprot:COSAG05_NODE_1992_length_3734_cov_2.706740_3_plen_81_part_00
MYVPPPGGGDWAVPPPPPGPLHLQGQQVETYPQGTLSVCSCATVIPKDTRGLDLNLNLDLNLDGFNWNSPTILLRACMWN